MQMTTAQSEAKAKNLSEEEIETFYGYGFAQYNSGHWKEAMETFQVLCIKRPMDPRFWFGLGATLQEASDYLHALHAWAMVALLKPSDPYPHFHAAECYFSLQNKEEATKALKEAAIKVTKDHHLLEEKINLLKEQWEV